MRGVIRGDKHFIDGKEVTKSQFDLAFPDRPLLDPRGRDVAGMKPANWPLASEALAVHPDQIPEARESARSKGVPTEFNGIGCPLFTSRQHRKEYLRAYGYHDKHGGFGD